MSEANDKSCLICEYNRDGECRFPDPQKGGDAPFMTKAVMPDPRDGGRNCMQFRSAKTLEEKR